MWVESTEPALVLQNSYAQLIWGSDDLVRLVMWENESCVYFQPHLLFDIIIVPGVLFTRYCKP
jgi:hypothetical protein